MRFCTRWTMAEKRSPMVFEIRPVPFMYYVHEDGTQNENLPGGTLYVATTSAVFGSAAEPCGALLGRAPRRAPRRAATTTKAGSK